MATEEQKPPEEEKVTCGTYSHFFEWPSHASTDCPPARTCYCGQMTYLAAMQAYYRRTTTDLATGGQSK